MENEVMIRHADVEDIEIIRSLAYQVWPVTYGNLMSADKLDYVLKLIYSPSALQNQMQQQGHTFLIAELDNEPLGFASFSQIKEDGVYKLHKIYVRSDIQGKGLGRALINAVTEHIKKFNATTLILNVKRDNNAKTFYEKFGFAVTREEDIDIGNGYFMNDYVMEKQL